LRVHIVKIGGSVISDKTRPFSIDYSTLEKVACALNRCIKKRCADALVIVHGGGGFGHYVVDEFGSVNSVEAFLRTVEVMRELNAKVVEVLRLKGVKALGIDTHAVAEFRGSSLRIDVDKVRTVIEMGLVPVLYGDAVVDIEEKSFKIASGDDICWELAYLLKAERLVFVTRVPGVFVGGRVAKVFSLSRDLRTLEDIGVGGHDVTGGMRAKLLKGVGKIKSIGAVYIVGFDPRIVEQALCLEPEVGTRVVE